jgi:hypothetical protein
MVQVTDEKTALPDAALAYFREQGARGSTVASVGR